MDTRPDSGVCSDNIRYDLLRTGDVQLTSNKILERGFLPAVCSLVLLNTHTITVTDLLFSLQTHITPSIPAHSTQPPPLLRLHPLRMYKVQAR